MKKTKALLALVVLGCWHGGAGHVWAKEGLVELQRPALEVGTEGRTRAVPYKARRKGWGFYAGGRYSFYIPKNYTSLQLPGAPVGVFGNYSARFIEAQLAAKWNSPLGSLGLDARGGVLFNTQSSGDNRARLTMFKLAVGGVWVLDAFLKEPWVAPFVGGGVYKTWYTEKNKTTPDDTAALSAMPPGAMQDGDPPPPAAPPRSR